MSPKTILPGTEDVNNIMNTCLHTCLLDVKCPVSLMLIGQSGGGKSVSLMRFEAPWIHHTNDVTSQGFFELLQSDKENKIRCIILPDFNVPLSHKPTVVSLTMANMLSLMSEGTARIDDGRHMKEIVHRPISIMSAVTYDMYFSYYKKWAALGITRRFLGIHFRYSEKTRRTANHLIAKGEIPNGPLPKIAVSLPIKPDGGYRVTIDDAMAALLEANSIILAEHHGYRIVRDYKTGKVNWKTVERALEFSPHQTLRSIAMAHALKKKRYKVSSEDVDFTTSLLDFTNPSNPASV